MRASRRWCSPKTRTLAPADVEELLKDRGECANGSFADADGTGNCAGKGQWIHDPDGYGEPVVNALHAADAAATWVPRPTITITSPSEGSSVVGVVTVTADAHADSGVVNVAFSVNGSPATTDTDGSDGWSFAWNTAPLPGGVYTISATATDTRRGEPHGHGQRQGRDQRAGQLGRQYGVDGYVIGAWNQPAADLAVLPAGVSYTIEQGTRTAAAWPQPTTDVRALESPTESERRAGAWYHATEVRLRLTFTSAYSGNLHLYAVDWGTTTRREDITVDDGSGPRTAKLTTSFNSGAWIHYPVERAGRRLDRHQGRQHGSARRPASCRAVPRRAGRTAPSPPPPPFTIDRPGVQGNWVGQYGVDGYVIGAWNQPAADLAVLPAGVSYTIEQGTRTGSAWPQPTTDVRALESPTESERRAGAWYHATEVRLRLTFTSAYSGNLHLYAVDWGTTTRREDITVDDGSGPGRPS